MLPRTDPLVVPRAQQGPKRELWEAMQGAERGQSIHSSDPFPPWGVRLVGKLGAEGGLRHCIARGGRLQELQRVVGPH